MICSVSRSAEKYEDDLDHVLDQVEYVETLHSYILVSDF